MQPSPCPAPYYYHHDLLSSTTPSPGPSSAATFFRVPTLTRYVPDRARTGITASQPQRGQSNNAEHSLARRHSCTISSSRAPTWCVIGRFCITPSVSGLPGRRESPRCAPSIKPGRAAADRHGPNSPLRGAGPDLPPRPRVLGPQAWLGVRAEPVRAHAPGTTTLVNTANAGPADFSRLSPVRDGAIKDPRVLPYLDIWYEPASPRSPRSA